MKTANRIDLPGEKALISTTSRLVGDYQGKTVSLALAFPQSDSIRERWSESPMSRSGVVVAYDAKPFDETEPVYSTVAYDLAQCVCSVISVLYGKRFDYHGDIEFYGRFRVPDLEAYWKPCLSDLPFNSHCPRTNFPIKLELGAAAIVEKWLVPQIDDAVVRRVQTACGFYARALRTAEQDAEAAYLYLVIAGEVIASLDQHLAKEKFDENATRDSADVETKAGQDCTNRLATRTTSKRKGFASALLRQLDEAFFRQTEPHVTENGRFKFEGMTSLTRREFDMCRCLKAAYDLRSHHVHSGAPFGHWVTPKSWVNDLVVGRPSLPDKCLAKVLEICPTFCGLERVIRYALLRRMAPPEKASQSFPSSF